MEDELFGALYPLVEREARRRPRRKKVRFTDALVLGVAFWAVLHDRPVCWACRAKSWHGAEPWPGGLPSPSTMSRRLRSLSAQLLLERVFHAVLGVAGVRAFCLCRRVDSKPLPVGPCSKDRDARRGHAAAGVKCKGYKAFCCWAGDAPVPEAVVLGPMSESDQAGAMHLIDRLQALHAGAACGYVAADATHDTNPTHAHAGARGLQMLTPRKKPGAGLGHRGHSPHRLRGIELLEPPPVPPASPAPRLGPELYRLRGRIERDFAHLCGFGGGLQPLPGFVRRPRRVAFWVVAKFVINGMRICRNHGLTP